MTPAEHYAEAERLIGMAANLPAGGDPGQLVAAAQAHATLATVDPDRLWPKSWVNPPVAQGRVIDAGGGEIHIAVDRDTEHYPDDGAHVLIFHDPPAGKLFGKVT